MEKYVGGYFDEKDTQILFTRAQEIINKKALTYFFAYLAMILTYWLTLFSLSKRASTSS